jgi:hypothetical protein
VMEHDWLSALRSPILIKDIDAVVGRDALHSPILRPHNGQR